MSLSVNDFNVKYVPSWCPGCGNFSLVLGIKNALVNNGLSNENVALFSGIGCGSKLPHFVKTYGFEGLHGRGIAIASGAKLANDDLTVIAVAGDGDTYGIGGNHFIHAARRNIDMTLIVQDNSVYGLTKGQYSPTSPKGFKSPSSPFGAVEEPLNPMATAITMGATFVARVYANDVKHLTEVITEAVKHKGFSFVDVLITCKTFNRANTPEWFTENLYKLEETGYKPDNKEEAWKKAQETDKLAVGIFYKENRETYSEMSPSTKKPPAKADITNVDISPIMKSLK